MSDERPSYRVAIVGGGPVGLYLACCLQQANISCAVFEKRTEAVSHSRSIGIHPVSLECLEKIGLADSFIDQGIIIREGLAFINRELIGTLSFASCPPPYSFILTLPQHKTETLLIGRLKKLNPNALWHDAVVTGIKKSALGVELKVKHGSKTNLITADYIIGCDGKESFVRQSASISFLETAYDDTYIMGDFGDDTDLGSKAAIYICKNGLIESFPLPDKMRRWVVKTDHYLAAETREEIESRICKRINHDLTSTENKMLSSFGVQKGLAETMAKERTLLAGDAAHLISPIGGQGMNLGWLDAADLAKCLEQVITTENKPDKILQSYSKRRLAIARKVIRRAEFNMALGRKTSSPLIKKTMLRFLLKKPISSMMARLFTMRGLHSLPF